MHQLLSYIKFLLTSSNQHGIHSPFVYQLVTECFYDRQHYPEYNLLEKQRQKLLHDKRIISITDFGSGSKVFDSNLRQISKIAKTSGTSVKNAQLLFRLVRYFQSASVLELGTNLGMGTMAMALGNPKAQITSIEGCPHILDIANIGFQQAKLQNVQTLCGTFTDEIAKLRNQSWDLVFFDGHHSKEATLNYFEQLLPTATNHSVFIFDDIYWSKGMTEAWQIIKEHPQVQVTVDTYHWGLVFFRKEQPKQHFKIRV